MENKMDISIDFDSISQMFVSAEKEGRNFLYEYEVYSLLSRSGAETPPQCQFIPWGSRPSDATLCSLPGEKTVLKIVSPTIIHKTEVGGVKIVQKEANTVRSALRKMFYEVPENYSALIERHLESAPTAYHGLFGEALTAAISRDIKGILQVQFMPPDTNAFGNELIVGLRHTREFGTIISAGLGGTDTELYASRFRKGQAIVAGSVEMNDGESFFQLFKQTISYKKIAGLTRGQRRIVTDEQLIECFESFIRMGQTYSLANSNASFIIEELEINPFAFTDYLMVPLDGMCRFFRPGKLPITRPVKKIDHLLHPHSIGIIGVSATRKNFGRIILDNILAEGFKKENTYLFMEGKSNFNGIQCYLNFEQFKNKTKEKLSLLVLAVGAQKVPDLVDKLIQFDVAHSIMLIPGSIGETLDSEERAQNIINMIDNAHMTEDGGPIFLGANCMGVISKPGGYDTWFIPEEKLPKQRQIDYHRAAIISQSGAFMLHRSHQYPQINPAYMISMGNQTDLTLGDMVHYFKASDRVDVIAIYAEGFNDLDGLKFCEAVREAVLIGKEVIFYKAGRTVEGKAATSSHTASLAGDYMVCESCVKKAGAILARTFSEFQELMFLSETLNGKTIMGNRLAAVSGAGFEAVGMADSIQSDDFHMTLAKFGKTTREKIERILKKKKLADFVTLTNPLDINPAADDDVHAEIAQILLQDNGVDAVIISLDPLSPAMKTLDNSLVPEFNMNHDQSIKNQLIRIVQNSKKPIVAVVDGGKLYDPLRVALINNNIPVFTVCDRAVAVLSLYIEGRINAEAIRRCRVSISS